MGPGHAAAGMTPSVPERHGELRASWGKGGLYRALGAATPLDRGPLKGLRAQAREELGLDINRPIIASGHQPTLVHPGILLRQLLLARLGRELSSLWVIVDSDAPREVAIPVPLLRRRYTRHSLVLADNPGRRILAELPVPPELAQAWPRIAPRLATLRNPRIGEIAEVTWGAFPSPAGPWSQWTEEAKRASWGLDVPSLTVTQLASTKAFRAFLELLFEDRARASDAYARAAEVGGLAPLPGGVLPLWTLREGRRVPASTMDASPLLPRALLLTLAVRALVCDFFIHGVGGAGYEPAVDLLFRELLGVEPPPWGWIVGTYLLPEPSAEQRELERDYPFFFHEPEPVAASLRTIAL